MYENTTQGRLNAACKTIMEQRTDLSEAHKAHGMTVVKLDSMTRERDTLGECNAMLNAKLAALREEHKALIRELRIVLTDAAVGRCGDGPMRRQITAMLTSILQSYDKEG